MKGTRQVEGAEVSQLKFRGCFTTKSGVCYGKAIGEIEKHLEIRRVKNCRTIAQFQQAFVSEPKNKMDFYVYMTFCFHLNF